MVHQLHLFTQLNKNQGNLKNLKKKKSNFVNQTRSLPNNNHHHHNQSK